MKKIALLTMALSLTSAFPAPLYFTFTGTVSFVPADVGGYAAAHGIRPGSAVTYIMVVDTVREGFTQSGGTKSPMADVNNPGYHVNNFFDSLIAPSLFSPAVTDSASGSYLGYRNTIQVNGSSRSTLVFQVTIGNPGHRTQITLAIPDTGAADFLPKVGDKAVAGEAYMNSSVASSSASSSLTLTAVSATRPSMALVPQITRPGKNKRAVFLGESFYFGTGTENRAFVDTKGRDIPLQ